MLLWPIIQLSNVANSVDVPSGALQSLPAIFVPPPTRTPHLGFLLTPRHGDSYWGLPLPAIMKSHECPDLDCPWPLWYWCYKCPAPPDQDSCEVTHSRAPLQDKERPPSEGLGLSSHPCLISPPPSYPFSSFPYFFTGTLRAHFLMHLLIKNTDLGVYFWVPRPTADRPPFL